MHCVECGKPTKPLKNGYGYRKTCSRRCLKELQSKKVHREDAIKSPFTRYSAFSYKSIKKNNEKRDIETVLKGAI